MARNLALVLMFALAVPFTGIAIGGSFEPDTACGDTYGRTTDDLANVLEFCDEFEYWSQDYIHGMFAYGGFFACK